MVPHRARLFTFFLKVGIPPFAAEKMSFFIKYSLCYPSCALFSAPSCALITLNGAPPSAPVYFLFKCWYTSFCCRGNFLFKIFFVLPIVCTFFCPIVRSYYFEWCPIERTCLPFIQRLVYLILLLKKLFLYKIFFMLPIVCTFFCPIVCSYYFEWCPAERTCLLFIQRLVYIILLLRKFLFV